MTSAPKDAVRPDDPAAPRFRIAIPRMVSPTTGPRPTPVPRLSYLVASALLMAAFWISAPARAAATACPVPTPIAFAGLDWDSGAFLTALDRAILERGYGCETTTTPGTTVTLEQAVATGDIEVIAEEWAGRSPIWNAASARGRVIVVGQTVTGGQEGIYVPDALVHGPNAPAAGLVRVEQLADPRYAALFRDPEQPTKARFLNCPSGWTCERVNTAKLHAYGLNDRYVDFRPGSGAAMDAAIVAAMVQHRPIVFYGYSPSTIAGRFRLFRLSEAPYDPGCWADLVNPDGQHRTACSWPPALLSAGLNAAFAARAPALRALFEKISIPASVLNAQLADAQAHQRSPAAQALLFLRTNPGLRRQWLSAEAAARLDHSLQHGDTDTAAASGGFPAGWEVSIRAPVNRWVATLVTNSGGTFRRIAGTLTALTSSIDAALRVIPWWLIIALFSGVTLLGARRTVPPLMVAAAFFVIGVLGLWDQMLQTLTLMLVSSLIALAIGLPLGIVTAKSRLARSVVPPILDFMQAMPGFVYLIPALMLLGLGKAPAILAMVIYATPPLIRLTALGIRNADPEVREAAAAFGATPWQTLIHVEMPLARDSILAGLNQMIMMALAMVVTASMIGARGLGEEVLNGIQSLDVGKGFEAGLAIVVLAMALDRTTQALVADRRTRRA
jgi:ABC-type proline/glycine betaine transport system permease subunit/ABC-type proline/glycine betaine transport system substrate-binding protein